jgi:glycosyltransferase involved in cell wall biosynthesis
MRLAIITSHPIQYHAPWFRFLAGGQESGEYRAERGVKGDDSPLSSLLSSVRVFYLWDGGVTNQWDRGFGVPVKWDIPLLDGYAHEFVPNRSRKPGPGHVSGLNNPTLGARVTAFKPDAVLVFGYNYLSHYRFLFSQIARSVPLLFRGDSHRLGRGERAEGRGQRSGGIKEALRRQWIAAVFRRFSAFLYVGQANRDYFKYHGVAEHQLFFCPHCVDNDRFIAQAEEASRQAALWKAELGIPPDHKVVLFAGKFEPKKRPGDLIAAVKLAKLENTTLLMVGNGELEPELRAAALGPAPPFQLSAFSISAFPHIIFAPFQNQTLMPRTYAAADVFVLPSLSESWGLAVNEAMCMSRPVIVSDHVGCAQDLVHDHRNGLIFPAGNVPALAAALQETFAEPRRLRAWGEQSREIIKGYSYEHATKGLLAALEYVQGENAET